MVILELFAVFSSKWLLIASLLSSFVVCKTFGFYVRSFSMTCEYFLGQSACAYGTKEMWKTIKCTGVHEKTRLGANNVASAPLHTWNFLNGGSIKGYGWMAHLGSTWDMITLISNSMLKKKALVSRAIRWCPKEQFLWKWYPSHWRNCLRMALICFLPAMFCLWTSLLAMSGYKV